MSGPLDEGPLPDDDVVPPSDDEKVDPSRWHAVMADSGTHWVSLNPRNPGRFDRPRGTVEDEDGR